jgi:hypothetical protein
MLFFDSHVSDLALVCVSCVTHSKVGRNRMYLDSRFRPSTCLRTH